MPNYSSIAQPTRLTASISSGNTTLNVEAASGYPSTPFHAILDKGTLSEEVVEVIVVSGTTWTARRGHDSTPAIPHTANATVHHGVVGIDLQRSSDHIEAETHVHGTHSAVVGQSDTQSLTNKSMSGSENSFSNIPQSSISGLPGPGGVVHRTASQTLENKNISSNQNNLSVNWGDIARFYLRRWGGGGTHELAPGNTGTTGTYQTQFSNGSWGGGGGLGSWQFSPPVSGIYMVSATVQWNNTSETQAGTVWFDFRNDMGAGGPSDSGSIVRTMGENTNWYAAHTQTITDIMYLTGDHIYGWTYRNNSNNYIERQMATSRSWYSVYYLGPV